MSETNRLTKALCASLLALWPVAGLWAQDAAAGKAALQAKVAELKQSLAANQKALQAYTWLETTEISLKGEVKKTEKKECRYGADGKVIKPDLPGAAPAPAQDSGGGGRGGRRKGAVRRRSWPDKVEDLKQYMADVAALVKQYVPPDPAKIQASAQAGKVSLNKETNARRCGARDRRLRPARRQALTFVSVGGKTTCRSERQQLPRQGQGRCALAVCFASLPDGVNYPAETVLVAKAKQIQVKITNSGHRK